MERKGKKKRHAWMIAPKGFIRLVGAEYDILIRAGKNVLAKFYISSLLIVIILIISYLSIHYAVGLLFETEVAESFLSIFFSSLFVFIYIFLLNTFTKQHLETQNRFFKLSNFVRIGFVVFMGFLISKPIEIFVFHNKLDEEVEIHRNQLVEEHQRSIDAYYSKELTLLESKADYYQGISNAGSVVQSKLNDVNERVREILDKKNQVMKVIREKVQRSPFFIYRVQQLSLRHKTSYLICFCVIILFLSPGFIIYNISKDNIYYQLKQEYEIDLVKRGYQDFLQYYSKIFLTKFSHVTEYHTVFEDPPFNTKRKGEKQYQDESEFFKKYRSGT